MRECDKGINGLKEKYRIPLIVLLTIILGAMVAFVLHTSEDLSWGHSFWEQWLLLHLHLKEATIYSMVFWARKTMHFTGYGLMGLLFWIYCDLWHIQRPQLFGLLATAAVAAVDEYAQSLTTFRAGKLDDVLLDIAGAVIVGWLVKWYRSKKAPTQQSR